MRHRFSLLAAVMAAVAIAGCGSSSSSSSSQPTASSFKQGYSAQKAQFTQLGTDLQTAVTGAPGKNNAQIATEFGSLSQRASAQATAIRNIGAPSQYTGERDQLAAGFDSIASNLQTISSDATSNNITGVKAASEQLVVNAAAVKQTDQRITSQLGLPQTS